jgi:cbb3-type cytochrome oxidase maturation protein
MSILYLLIVLALALLVLAVWALFWAIGNRQFDDLESQGWSVVLDDDQKPPQSSTTDRSSSEAIEKSQND